MSNRVYTHWYHEHTITRRVVSHSGKLSREKNFHKLVKIQFSWRKLSRIVRFCHAKRHHAHKFCGENFRKRHKIPESFLPRKLPAIRYTTEKTRNIDR